MRVMLLLLVGALACFSQDAADRAILPLLQRAAPGIKGDIFHRAHVTPDLDLVIAIAGSDVHHWLGGPSFSWTKDTLLALYLQQRSNPSLVYSLTYASGFDDCEARIERATSTDTVVSCTAEKVGMNPSQKFIYDTRAKALVAQMEYQPFGILSLVPIASGAFLWASDGVQTLGIEYIASTSTFRILEHAPPRPEPRRPAIAIAVPQTTYDDFAAVRPQRVRDGYRREFTEFHEEVGPTQSFGGKIWFGKTFYDGEGHTGVGGFGTFEPTRQQLTLMRLPQLNDFSASAILVDETTVWLGLVHRTEYNDITGGLLRYDRDTETARVLPTPGKVVQIVRIKGQTLIAHHLGFDVIDEDGRWTRFLVDKTSDGRVRVTTAESN